MKLNRLAAVGVALVLLSGCGPAPSRRTVADYFSPPQRPGPTWEKNGRPVDHNELNSVAGPEHCDWQNVVMLRVGWPLGTVSRHADQTRQFIRDPEGAIEDFEGLDGTVEIGVELPSDARYTGYHIDDLQLWLSTAEPDAAYLRVGENVERWPRAEPQVACM
jgi:hypothetical protein